MDIPYYEIADPDELKSKHAPMFPRTIFCVIAGPTGSGKTNLMVHLLVTPDLLDYGDVYIYAPTLHQKSYKYLKEYYTKKEIDIQYILKQIKLPVKPIKICHFFDVDHEIKDPSELNTNISHIMLFDDVMNTDQTKIKDYFCRGRHNNVNVFYLCQSLYKIQKHCIRDNANMFILFHQDDQTLKRFYDTHISGDMTFEEFHIFCNDSWSRKCGFVIINLMEKPYCGKYLRNLSDIYLPNKYIKTQINT